MLKNAPIVPLFTYYKGDQCLSATRTINSLEKYLQEQPSEKTLDPSSMATLKTIKSNLSQQLSMQAFGMCVKFLEEHLLAEQCLHLFEYCKFDPSSYLHQHDYMILDSQAIEHLELIDLAPLETEPKQ